MTDRTIVYKDFLYSGFCFPDSFISSVSKIELEDLAPWWFFCSSANYVEFWCKKVRELYPERMLIPFANWRYSDDIVCFDGADTSGEPKVYYVHAFASVGWEDRGYADNFDEWLRVARIESARYKSERAEDQE